MQETFLLREIVVVLIIFVMSGYALYQSRAMLKRKHPAASLSVPMACFTISLSALFLVDGVSLSISQWTGINNLGWYLGYAIGMFGLYQFGYMACQTDLHPYGATIERWLRIMMVVVLVIMSIIYVVYMASEPESAARIPRSPWEMLFSVSFFLYATSMVIAALMTVRLAWQKEQNPAQKLRLWITRLSVNMAIFFFVAKIIFFLVHYYIGGALWINQGSLVALGATGLLLPLSLLPGSVFRWLILHSPIRYARHLFTLFVLRQLQTRLYRLLPSMPVRGYPLPYTLFNLQRAIYRAVITILDGKKMLDAYLVMDDHKRAKQIGFTWSAELQEGAQELHHVLSAIDALQNDDYGHLIQALLKANRQVKMMSKHDKRGAMVFG